MLCCIGDLVEDVVVWPSEEPRRGTDTTAQVFRRRGGSAATVAVYAAAAGTPARFVGQVGADRLGTMLISELETAGVDVKVTRGGTTGSVVVLVDQSGERTMLADRGAATQLAGMPEDALADVTWLHVPAYSLFVEPLGSTTQAAIRAVQASGGQISIDASSVGPLAEFGVESFIDVVRSLEPDVVLCNEDEAALLDVGDDKPLPGAKLTIIKAGPAPVTLVEPSRETRLVAVPPVEDVEDTTGAGDAFAAGFIAATIEGSDAVEATKAGCRLAATVLVRPGAGS